MLATLKRLVALLRAEPALLAAIGQGIVALIVTRCHLTGPEAAAIEAAAAALFAAVVAVLTRPLRVAPLTALITAAGTLLAAFGVHGSAGDVSLANAVLAALMLAYTSLRVTPTVTLKAEARHLPEHAAHYLP
jgi:uncharacterized membrane protein